MMSNELFHGIQFDDIWLAHICGSMRPGKMIVLGGNYNYGHRVARGYDVMGKETSWGAWFDLRPSDQLVISNRFNWISSDDVDTGELLFEDFINRTEIGYQVSRELSFRLIMQYSDSRKSWSADPLLTYRLNALSTFYLGSTRNYRDFETQPNGAQGWLLSSRQYFVKLQYLFRI